MYTNFFEAIISPAVSQNFVSFRGQLHTATVRTGVDVKGYGPAAGGEASYAGVTAGLRFDTRWMDRFVISTTGGNKFRGRCLWPGGPAGRALKQVRRLALLERLAAGEKEMMLVLAERAGLKGLNEEDVTEFSRLSRNRLEKAAIGLEEEGQVLILLFSPLFLVTRAGLEFYKEKIVTFLRLHGEKPGLDADRIGKRFAAHPRVTRLALWSLVKEGKLDSSKGFLSLMGPGSGEKTRSSMNPARLEPDLAIKRLTELKQVHGQEEDFSLSSGWLQSLIGDLRSSGRREISLAEFKAMTGLPRKQVISVLELLDRLGVTRRKGSTRDILPGR